MLSTLFKQCVGTVEYVHSTDISHGGMSVLSPALCVIEAGSVADLDLSNSALARPDFSTFAEIEVVCKLFTDLKRNVTKIRRRMDHLSPKVFMRSFPARLRSMIRIDVDNLLVKLVDFGGGKLTFSVVHSAYPLTPRNTQRSRQLLNSTCTPTLETLLQSSSMGLPPHRGRISGPRSTGSSIAAPSI